MASALPGWSDDENAAVALRHEIIPSLNVDRRAHGIDAIDRKKLPKKSREASVQPGKPGLSLGADMPEFILFFPHITGRTQALAHSARAIDEQRADREGADELAPVKIRCTGRALSRLLAMYPDISLDVVIQTSVRSRLRRVRDGHFVTSAAVLAVDEQAHYAEIFLRGAPAARGTFLADLHHLRSSGCSAHPAILLRTLVVCAGRDGDELHLVVSQTPTVTLLLDVAEAYPELVVGVLGPACFE